MDCKQHREAPEFTRFSRGVADSRALDFQPATQPLGNEPLARYWSYVRPENLDLERSLDSLDLERLRDMDSQAWYQFLRDEYFVWKYTAANRYASTTGQLQRYVDDDALDELDAIRRKLLSLDTDDIRLSLYAAEEIRGLGTAGASGLLADVSTQVCDGGSVCR